jgi:predicted nucleic acid-binding Zn ribbon protein
MDRAADLLGRVARKIKRPEASMVWLASSWSRIVGKTIAAHTRPLRCQNGCLEIAADGKVWQRQLESMSRDFCAQINRAWGSILVREVKFATAKNRPAARAGSAAAGPSTPASVSRSIAYELDNDHIPFIRRRK